MRSSDLIPIVFLPGFMSDARLFRDQAEALSPDFSVQVASLGPADNIRDMAARVIADLPQEAALVGASLGGMVAMEVLRRAPERVARLVLIATDALSELPAVAAARDPMISRAKAGRLDDAMAEAVPVDTLAPGPSRAAALDTLRKMARRAGPTGFAAQSRALQRRPDQQGTLRRIAVPTLLICGAHDRIFACRRHEVMAGLVPQAKLVTLEEAGHLPTLECPHKVTEILAGWLVN